MKQICTVLRSLFLLNFVSIWAILPVYSLAAEKLKSVDPQIQVLFEQKKYLEVIQNLSKITDVLDVKGLMLLGKSYSNSENPMAAIKTYTLALTKKEKNFEAKTMIAHEYLNMKKERDALAALREALEYNPKYEPAYLELEQLYIKKNNKYELRTLFIDMIQNVGEKAEYRTRLCEISYSSGLYEAATADCRRGIILNKEEPKNYVILALTFKETGNRPEAVSLLKRAADNFTKSFDSQLTYASLLEEEKNYIESQKYYRKAVDLQPTSLKALVGLASTTVELQKFSEAIETYAKACKVNRNTVVALRKSIVSLKGFKANEFITKYEDLAETCGLTP